MSNNGKESSILNIIDKLIIPILLGILAWTADNSANKIAESQNRLAESQFNIQEDREARETDAQLVDLFGKYYFSNVDEQRDFAVKLISKLTSPELQKSLAELVISNPQESKKNQQEASTFAEIAQQKICNQIGVGENFWRLEKKPSVIYVEIKNDTLEDLRRKLMNNLNKTLNSSIAYGQQIHPNLNFDNEVRYFYPSDKEVALGIKCITDQISANSFTLVLSGSPNVKQGQIEIWINK